MAYTPPAEYPFEDSPSTDTPVYAATLDAFVESLDDLDGAGGRVADLETHPLIAADTSGAAVGQVVTVTDDSPLTFDLRMGAAAVHIDDHGGDPTGAADSTAAFNAALAALPEVTIAGTTYRQGTIRFGQGVYDIGATETDNIGPLVSVLGPGKAACTINYTGSGRGLYMHDVGIPTKFVNLAAWAGTIDGFTLVGTAAAGAIGIDYGDTEGGIVGPDLLIKGFTGVGAVGLYLSNRYWWTENVKVWASIFGCTTGLMLDGTRGPGANSYNSFEYNDIEVKVYLLPNQRGVVLDNGAWFGNGRMRIRANCALSNSANTGALLTLQGQSASGHLTADEYSWFHNSELTIQAETNSSTEYGSTNGPKTIVFGAVNDQRIFGTIGTWSFDGPGWQPFDGTGWVKTNIQHLGPVVGDTTLQPSTTHRGATILGATARPQGVTVASGGNAQVRVNSGDFHAFTLTQNTLVQLVGGFAGPREITIALTQAASGGPYSVSWQSNGTPTLTAPTIVWSGGNAPYFTATAGATDLFRLTTLDGLTWYGTRLYSTGNATLESGKSVRLYAPSGQSLPSGATTPITGMTQEFNDDTAFYTVDAANGTVTVVRGGTYLASWAVRTLGGSAGKRFSSIQVGGTDRGKHGVNSVGGGGVADITGLSAPIRLSAGNVVRLAIYVDGGTAATVTGNVPYDTGFSLTYLGG